MTTDVQTVQSLEALASEINAEHQQCMEALQTGVQHALNAGQLLVEAKSQVAHGDWGAWLEANVTFSDRTARGYMRVARELPNLEEGNRQRVADLSLRGTLKLLATPTDTSLLEEAEAVIREHRAIRRYVVSLVGAKHPEPVLAGFCASVHETLHHISVPETTEKRSLKELEAVIEDGLKAVEAGAAVFGLTTDEFEKKMFRLCEDLKSVDSGKKRSQRAIPPPT